MNVRSLAVIAFALSFAAPAVAQVSSDSINVNAQNVGAFVFNIAETSYNFGQVSSLGGSNVGGTEPLTGTANATSATYTSSASAVTFNVASAPPRTVYFYNSSPAQTLAWGDAADLLVRLTATGATSCGFKALDVTGDGLAGTCNSGNLAHSLAGVGRAVNSKNGNIEFQVTVDDTDVTGTNTWVVQITAAAP